MPITYRHINKDEVLANFRRARGVVADDRVTDQQAQEAAVQAMVAELDVEQANLLMEKETSDELRGRLENAMQAAQQRHNEAKNLAKILRQHTEVNTDLACVNWLQNRLQQLEAEHACLAEIRAHPEAYGEAEGARDSDIQITEAAWTVARDRLEELAPEGVDVFMNREQRRVSARNARKATSAKKVAPKKVAAKKVAAKRAAAKKTT